MTNVQLSSFYAQHRRPFLLWAWSRYHLSRQDASDIYQEAILAFMGSKATRSDGAMTCAPATFLFAIARNLALKHLRMKHRWSAADGIPGHASEPSEPPRSEADTEREQALRIVQETLSGLPERQRHILQLFYFEDHSMQEIANIMGYHNAGVARKMKHDSFRNLALRIRNNATFVH